MNTRIYIQIPTTSECKQIPLPAQIENAFNAVKIELEVESLNSIDEVLPFVAECVASESTIYANLNQDGRPVAFIPRTILGSVLHYSTERSRDEAVRKW